MNEIKCTILYSTDGWYLLNHSNTSSTHMTKIGDYDPTTCDEVDIVNHSTLLKTTLTTPFASLEVNINIKLPRVNFGPEQLPCGYKAPSLLMTHDSSTATAEGRKCKLFCTVPHVCRLVDVTVVMVEDILQYEFSCRCSHQSCNELFLMLQPELRRDAIEICHANWSRTDNQDGKENNIDIVTLSHETKPLPQQTPPYETTPLPQQTSPHETTTLLQQTSPHEAMSLPQLTPPYETTPLPQQTPPQETTLLPQQTSPYQTTLSPTGTPTHETSQNTPSHETTSLPQQTPPHDTTPAIAPADVSPWDDAIAPTDAYLWDDVIASADASPWHDVIAPTDAYLWDDVIASANAPRRRRHCPSRRLPITRRHCPSKRLLMKRRADAFPWDDDIAPADASLWDDVIADWDNAPWDNGIAPNDDAIAPADGAPWDDTITPSSRCLNKQCHCPSKHLPMRQRHCPLGHHPMGLSNCPKRHRPIIETTKFIPSNHPVRKHSCPMGHRIILPLETPPYQTIPLSADGRCHCLLRRHVMRLRRHVFRRHHYLTTRHYIIRVTWASLCLKNIIALCEVTDRFSITRYHLMWKSFPCHDVIMRTWDAVSWDETNALQTITIPIKLQTFSPGTPRDAIVELQTCTTWVDYDMPRK